MRYGSRLAINLDLLGQNIESLKKLCPNNTILFMVKANGYGHGLVEVSRYALKKGVTEFGCATLAEAVMLREQLKNEKFEVYVFSDFNLNIKEQGEQFLEKRIIPVITNDKDLAILLEDKKFQHFPLCLKFNTGMNRLGLSCQEAGLIADKILSGGRKKIFHLMTHMACASSSHKEHPQNISQRQNFEVVKKQFLEKGLVVEATSLANSGTIEQGFGLEESHIRPGLMLYGPTSLNDDIKDKSLWKGKIISSLETEIIKVREIKKGEPVGYGGTIVPHDGRLAIVALGYGDGLSTNYDGAEMYYGDFKGIICGRVNMDMAHILFPPEAKIVENSTIQIWSQDPIKFSRLCKQTRMIPYELFCQITSRVPRIYRETSC